MLDQATTRQEACAATAILVTATVVLVVRLVSSWRGCEVVRLQGEARDLATSQYGRVKVWRVRGGEVAG